MVRCEGEHDISAEPGLLGDAIAIPSSQSSARVLVVDDSELSRKLLCYLLRTQGFHVDAVADAESSEVAILATRPDVVLVDIELPGMDGLALSRRLRAQTATTNLVIVIVTARAMAGDREKGFDAGCDEYLAKPIDTRALPDLIRTLLSLRHQRLLAT